MAIYGQIPITSSMCIHNLPIQAQGHSQVITGEAVRHSLVPFLNALSAVHGLLRFRSEVAVVAHITDKKEDPPNTRGIFFNFIPDES